MNPNEPQWFKFDNLDKPASDQSLSPENRLVVNNDEQENSEKLPRSPNAEKRVPISDPGLKNAELADLKRLKKIRLKLRNKKLRQLQLTRQQEKPEKVLENENEALQECEGLERKQSDDISMTSDEFYDAIFDSDLESADDDGKRTPRVLPAAAEAEKLASEWRGAIIGGGVSNTPMALQHTTKRMAVARFAVRRARLRVVLARKKAVADLAEVNKTLTDALDEQSVAIMMYSNDNWKGTLEFRHVRGDELAWCARAAHSSIAQFRKQIAAHLDNRWLCTPERLELTGDRALSTHHFNLAVVSVVQLLRSLLHGATYILCRLITPVLVAASCANGRASPVAENSLAAVTAAANDLNTLLVELRAMNRTGSYYIDNILLARIYDENVPTILVAHTNQPSGFDAEFYDSHMTTVDHIGSALAVFDGRRLAAVLARRINIDYGGFAISKTQALGSAQPPVGALPAGKWASRRLRNETTSDYFSGSFASLTSPTESSPEDGTNVAGAGSKTTVSVTLTLAAPPPSCNNTLFSGSGTVASSVLFTSIDKLGELYACALQRSYAVAMGVTHTASLHKSLHTDLAPKADRKKKVLFLDDYIRRRRRKHWRKYLQDMWAACQKALASKFSLAGGGVVPLITGCRHLEWLGLIAVLETTLSASWFSDS